ncbi:MAG: PIN domain-containing protein [Candidatus Aminicenantes bacterium]|nr:PIN domain-containing protein [Candidatus Aminicenantes bacterium]
MSAERVLIDTSVWVDYFRGTTPLVSDKVDALLAGDEIWVPMIVLAELIQGAKSIREVAAIEGFLEAFTIVEPGPDTWLEAARLSRKLKGRGRTVHLIDCYIAVIAHGSGCALFTLDAHFREIAEVLPLRLF